MDSDGFRLSGVGKLFKNFWVVAGRDTRSIHRADEVKEERGKKLFGPGGVRITYKFRRPKATPEFHHNPTRWVYVGEKQGWAYAKGNFK
ncbi:hypothetical protein KEM54_005734 [Ascosphaera aggregata]|nr:hypothetical protein KEM54_005734 [Ascosphaera aggregata]